MNRFGQNITSKYVVLINGELAICMEGEGCIPDKGSDSITVYVPRYEDNMEVKQCDIDRLASKIERENMLSEINESSKEYLAEPKNIDSIG